jgi:protein-disulfide isomerase
MQTERSPNQAIGTKVTWFALGAAVGALAIFLIIGATTESPRANFAASPTANPPTGNEVALPDPRPFAPKVAIRPQNTMGDANARVVIVEYSDFNCGFCRRFYQETFPRLINEYVNTGKVRMSFKHYPFLRPSSVWKAHAAECAAAQGRFWDYHGKLFSSEVGGGDDEASVKQALVGLASELGLNTELFTACLNDSAGQQQALSDAQEGRRLGVSGTPSFLVNGRPLVGAQPFEAFRAIIEEELANAPPR